MRPLTPSCANTRRRPKTPRHMRQVLVLPVANARAACTPARPAHASDHGCGRAHVQPRFPCPCPCTRPCPRLHVHVHAQAQCCVSSCDRAPYAPRQHTYCSALTSRRIISRCVPRRCNLAQCSETSTHADRDGPTVAGAPRSIPPASPQRGVAAKAATPKSGDAAAAAAGVRPCDKTCYRPSASSPLEQPERTKGTGVGTPPFSNGEAAAGAPDG